MLVQLGPLVRLVPLVMLVHKGPLAMLVHKGLLVMLVHKGLLVMLVHKAPLVMLVRLVMLARMEKHFLLYFMLLPVKLKWLMEINQFSHFQTMEWFFLMQHILKQTV
jgi:hypothetical protein